MMPEALKRPLARVGNRGAKDFELKVADKSKVHEFKQVSIYV